MVAPLIVPTMFSISYWISSVWACQCPLEGTGCSIGVQCPNLMHHNSINMSISGSFRFCPPCAAAEHQAYISRFKNAVRFWGILLKVQKLHGGLIRGRSLPGCIILCHVIDTCCFLPIACKDSVAHSLEEASDRDRCAKRKFEHFCF